MFVEIFVKQVTTRYKCYFLKEKLSKNVYYWKKLQLIANNCIFCTHKMVTWVVDKPPTLEKRASYYVSSRQVLLTSQGGNWFWILFYVLQTHFSFLKQNPPYILFPCLSPYIMYHYQLKCDPLFFSSHLRNDPCFI